jgi:hypothetical protein
MRPSRNDDEGRQLVGERRCDLWFAKNRSRPIWNKAAWRESGEPRCSSGPRPNGPGTGRRATAWRMSGEPGSRREWAAVSWPSSAGASRRVGLRRRAARTDGGDLTAAENPCGSSCQRGWLRRRRGGLSRNHSGDEGPRGSGTRQFGSPTVVGSGQGVQQHRVAACGDRDGDGRRSSSRTL